MVTLPGSAAHEALSRARPEYVLLVSGVVRERDAANPRLPTGAVELVADTASVLNAVSRSLPFAVSGEAASEEVRLRRGRPRLLRGGSHDGLIFLAPGTAC